jgi:retron-type reverse transcriptase
MFQMPDIEKFLIENNKHEILYMLKTGISQLRLKRSRLKELAKQLKHQEDPLASYRLQEFF